VNENVGAVLGEARQNGDGGALISLLVDSLYLITMSQISANLGFMNSPVMRTSSPTTSSAP
jgi:hypothetical protein